MDLKFGYIGEPLLGVSRKYRGKARGFREPVETNTPNSPNSGLKIESELMGDYESDLLVTTESKTQLPNVVRDILNDTSFNGLTDIVKRDPEMSKMLFELPKNDDVISFAGVTFKQTSTAPTVTISGNTYSERVA